MTCRIPVACLLAIGAACLLEGCASSGFMKTTDLSLSSCLSHAKQTLYDADFGENLVVSREQATVSGHHDGYDATLFCGTESHLVRVEVRGLDSDQDDWYKSTIIRKF
jgi:hypothetical protein